MQNTRASEYRDVSQISKLKLSMERVCLGTSKIGDAATELISTDQLACQVMRQSWPSGPIPFFCVLD